MELSSHQDVHRKGLHLVFEDDLSPFACVVPSQVLPSYRHFSQVLIGLQSLPVSGLVLSTSSRGNKTRIKLRLSYHMEIVIFPQRTTDGCRTFDLLTEFDNCPPVICHSTVLALGKAEFLTTIFSVSLKWKMCWVLHCPVQPLLISTVCKLLGHEISLQMWTHKYSPVSPDVVIVIPNLHSCVSS